VRRWPLTAVLTLAGCAYYNGLWSANRLASDARKYEARGMVAEARLNWGRAAAKAETVLVHHPHSRWADDALVLQGEGLARSGTCAAALAPLHHAIATVTDDALRERASLAAATCAVQQGSLSDAERYLAPVFESHDASRRSRPGAAGIRSWRIGASRRRPGPRRPRRVSWRSRQRAGRPRRWRWSTASRAAMTTKHGGAMRWTPSRSRAVP
jgi:hypothetical protein